jgi:predicted small secreted protein
VKREIAMSIDVLRLIAAAVAALFFAGCNTMSGVGKDIERGGEKIEGAAERNR